MIFKKKWFGDVPIQSVLTLINVAVVLAALMIIVDITLGYK